MRGRCGFRSFTLTICRRGATLADMKSKTVFSLAVLTLAAALFSVSCSSEQQIQVQGDGSGSGSLRIDLHPMFVQYLKDVSAGFIEGDMEAMEFSAFDLREIAATMRDLDGISLVSAQTEGEGGLELSYVFSDPEAILQPIEFSSRGNLRTLRVLITAENFEQLFPLVGMEEQDTLMTFGPQPDPYSEEEYVEMMEYALGDYEDAATIRRVLERRRSELNVSVDGPITEARGFILNDDGRSARATIPYLRAATLREPLDLSLSWRSE